MRGFRIEAVAMLVLLAGCRAEDTPEPIAECDDYARAVRECSHQWISGDDPGVAVVERVVVSRRDAGIEDREELRAKCRRASERTRRRCGGEP
jgi:hypothetical protein